MDGGRYLSSWEVRKLLSAAAGRVPGTQGARNGCAVRDHFVMHAALATGLRVSELAHLRCGDVFLGHGTSRLVVRRGKGGKSRTVAFNGAFANHVLEYLAWKQETGEPVDDGAPLLLSSVTGRAMTTRALQKAFKRCAARAGLSPRYSIHCLRHTYACHLYKASGWNLRLVQKQLGHSSIATTQVYADVMAPDLRRALERLYR